MISSWGGPRTATTTFLVAAAASWGLGAVLSKHALEGYPASVLLPLQLLCSAVTLGAVMVVTRQPVRSIGQPARLAALGVLNPGVAYALGLIGLSSINASTSVVIWATEPVIIVVMALAVLREPATPRAVGSLATAMIGIALIVGAPSAGDSALGVALTFVSVSACALYTILLRRMNLTDSTLPIVWIQQLSALAFAAAVLLVWNLVNTVTVDPSASTTVAAVASGVTYYGLGFLLYVSGLRRTSATRAGTFLTLIPVFGLGFSALLLGERFTWVQAIGAFVVITSMAALTLSDQQRGQRELAHDSVEN
jgi:probable blue pigment (indigoidine) exporter